MKIKATYGPKGKVNPERLVKQLKSYLKVKPNTNGKG